VVVRTPAALQTRKSRKGDDAHWDAVVARDASCDDRFFYAVTTTRVYCRPSCGARLPKRENVRFFASGMDAEAAGFRPCKRCKPDGTSRAVETTQKIALACRLIETAQTAPALEDLAKACGLSPHHFHRVFKAVTGVTPKGYAMAHRQKRIRETLKTGGSVTEAIHEAGFNSSGRFYADATRMLGMSPADYRAGGKNARLRFAVGKCSLGSVLVAASEQGISAISFGDDPDALVRALQDRFPQAELFGGDGAFEQVVARVVGFVDDPANGMDLPLDVRGTAFQHRVWKALCKIPPGSTATYAQIAKRIGNPKAVRAVAQACAANPLAVAIPCHRVVRTDGSLSGYRWGVERKRALLEKEAKDR